jgi:hypothetical protein
MYKAKLMPSSSQKQKYQDTIDAARCNLELALMLLNELPDDLQLGLQELASTKTCVNEALLASFRLSLELGLVGPLPLTRAPTRLSLVANEEKAS